MQNPIYLGVEHDSILQTLNAQQPNIDINTRKVVYSHVSKERGHDRYTIWESLQRSYVGITALSLTPHQSVPMTVWNVVILGRVSISYEEENDLYMGRHADRHR